jgi:ribonuclease E
MPNKMLIDATHPEETRVVVVRGNRVEEFDFETAQRKQLRGNIYLAKVTRVEPSLQAAFIEYGGNRHGFLAFSEIHPDYYQIPVADRQALIEAEERAHREAEEENENRSSRRRSRHRSSRRRSHGERVQSDIVEGADANRPLTAEAPAGDHATEHELPEANEAAGLHPSRPELIENPFDRGEAVHPHDDLHGHQDHDHEGHAHESHGHESHGHEDHDHHHDDHHHDEHDHQEHDHEDHPHGHEEHPGLSAEARSEAPVGIADAATPEHADSAQDRHGHADHDHDHDTPHLGHHDEHALAPHDDAPAVAPGHDADDEDEDDEEEEDVVESVGGDDALEEVPERAFRPRRQYKIQEVIKRRQVMLVQVVKEERGNKGAALTTYLSLAGRYAVLMPNTARGGGISRKITSAQDRSRLKEVVQDLDVPEGMGIILRTAGASRTKPEIKRDFEYLIRMWETVRDMTLKSQAPTLVYEEGSLIKRSLRDLYNKEIDEIMVAGEPGYREAHDFMKMLMPTNVRAVRQYRDGQPLFSRMGVESQLDAMFSPTVQLRSGGYIVINQTEALVSIDVNSGRATREHHIEDTALKTNLEASEEVARQLRLRDLAGLIVIDFIDMDEKRNNRAVERKLSDCLRQDRARIQVGRISHFGLLEMSRQRIRASVLESSTEPCPQCGGTGHVRSVSSVALQLLRGLEETMMKGATHNLVARTRTDVALYVLNHKRGHLRDLESSFKVTLAVIADPTVTGPQSFVIDRGEQVHTLEAAKALLVAQAAATPPPLAEEAYDDDEAFDVELESEVETEETEGLSDEVSAVEANGEPGQDGQRRGKRRRRRRGARSGETREAGPREERDETEGPGPAPVEFVAANDTVAAEDDDAAEDGAEEPFGAPRPDGNGERRPRRRGRRGGRRRRGGPEDGLVGSIADELAPPEASEAQEAVADFDGVTADSAIPRAPAEPAMALPETRMAEQPAHEPVAAAVEEPAAEPQTIQEADRPARRSTVREKVSFVSNPTAETAVSAPVAPHVPELAPAPAESTAAETGQAAPRKAGWWSRRFGGGE